MKKIDFITLSVLPVLLVEVFLVAGDDDGRGAGDTLVKFQPTIF
jgi:hypothetical protein